MVKRHNDALLRQLQEKSREELLELLKQLIQQQPTLEALIETLLKLPSVSNVLESQKPGKGGVRTLDPANIRSQVAAILSRAEWGEANFTATELYRVSEIGDRFNVAGQWANVQAVYATIIEEILPVYEEVEDEDQIAGVLGDCIGELITCLEVQETLQPEDQLEEADRQALVTSLFAVWKFGYNSGIGTKDIIEALAQQTTQNERDLLEQWARQELGANSSSTGQDRYINDFLARIKAEH